LVWRSKRLRRTREKKSEKQKEKTERKKAGDFVGYDKKGTRRKEKKMECVQLFVFLGVELPLWAVC